MRPEGFEPPTNGFGSHYSIRLSYERLAAHYARTAGVRVMGLGDTGPGQPRRHSRCDDTGLSAGAFAGRHRMPRFKRTGSRRAAARPSQAAVARCKPAQRSPPDRQVEHAPERGHCRACGAIAPPAPARLHQRTALAARNLDRCGQPYPIAEAGHCQDCRPHSAHMTTAEPRCYPLPHEQA